MRYAGELSAQGAHARLAMLTGSNRDDYVFVDWTAARCSTRIAVNGSDTFLLEAHYNNKTGAAFPDASGVEICVTPKKKVVVNRKGGMKETIHDEDFDFEYQRSYNFDVTLQPRDTLTTTCTTRRPRPSAKGRPTRCAISSPTPGRRAP